MKEKILREESAEECHKFGNKPGNLIDEILKSDKNETTIDATTAERQHKLEQLEYAQNPKWVANRDMLVKPRFLLAR